MVFLGRFLLLFAVVAGKAFLPGLADPGLVFQPPVK